MNTMITVAVECSVAVRGDDPVLPTQVPGVIIQSATASWVKKVLLLEHGTLFGNFDKSTDRPTDGQI